MSVLLETSKGDIVIDLYTEECPLTCKNFLKLCKIKYYNNSLFHNVQQNFIAQSGAPAGETTGGTSVYGVMYGDQARFFDDEIKPHLKHKQKGTVAMASAGKNLNASQFYITLAPDLDSLDEKHTVFGEVAEGLEVLDALNEAYCDEQGRPWVNIRIRHTIILDDPYEDPPQLAEHIPGASPPPAFEQGQRLEDDWVPLEDSRPVEEVEEESRKHEAANRAVVLEMVGDLPDADVKPPSNMLFVCKLNPVTREEDLEIIFSRFGNVTSCDIIRDYKTGDSLCYAFIGYDSDEACVNAYFKMNNVSIDDRRIKVDFSQSVHHIWRQFRRFGKKGGNAELAQQADQHQVVRPTPGANTAYKDDLQVLMAGGARGGHGLLLEQPGEMTGRAERRTHHKRSRSPQRPHDRQLQGRHQEQRSSRDRDRDRDRGRGRSSERAREYGMGGSGSGSGRGERPQEQQYDRDRHRARGYGGDRAEVADRDWGYDRERWRDRDRGYERGQSREGHRGNDRNGEQGRYHGGGSRDRGRDRDGGGGGGYGRERQRAAEPGSKRGRPASRSTSPARGCREQQQPVSGREEGGGKDKQHKKDKKHKKEKHKKHKERSSSASDSD